MNIFTKFETQLLWVLLILSMLCVAIVSLLVPAKTKGKNSEAVTEQLDLNKCKVRSVVWFNDKGAAIAGKGLVCDVVKTEE
jgi:hypothetical protein